MADKEKEGKEGKEDKKEGDEKKSLLDKLDPTKALTVPTGPPKPKPLEKGDYVVIVHIIEARDLIGVDPIGDISDPVVCVTCMEKKQHTRILKKQLNPMWDEVLVFEFKDCYPEQIERNKVRAAVFDDNLLLKNEMIGSYEFDLATIYYRENHELYRQWCALSDITDKREGIQGYLKLSITVLGPNDEQYIHSAADEDDEDSAMLGVLMPPEVEQVGKLLKIKCYSMMELPVMDDALLGGKCDPFIKVEYAGIDIKTKIFKGLDIPDVQSELQIPVMEPILSNNIKIAFWDHDLGINNDDRISQLKIDYNEIKEKKGIPPRWYPLYGAPEGKQTGVAKQMNQGFIPGTFYRGKALLAFELEDSKEPKKEVVVCNSLSAAEKPPEVQYVLRCDLYEGSEVPNKGKMHIEIHCGKNSNSSDKVEVTEGRAEWYVTLKDLVFTAPKDVTQVPDVFLYLCNGKTRLSYWRTTMKEIYDQRFRKPPFWAILTEDPALDKLGDNEFPGSILFCLTGGLFDEAPNEPFPETRPLKYDIVEPEPSDEKGGEEKGGELVQSPTFRKRADDDKVSTVGTLVLTVMQGANLPIMDAKTSDPYCKIKIGNTQQKTTVKKKNLNPTWNEAFTFKEVSLTQELKLQVYDQDTLKDDIMGEQNIDMRSIQLASKQPGGTDFVHEQWFGINDKHPSAQIRLRFEFKYLDLAKSQEIQKKLTEKSIKESKSILKVFTKKKENRGAAGGALGYAERKDYQLRVHLYQARSLPALDANGLADPYVVVRLCGKKIKFDKKRETLNPVWYKSASVNVKVPQPLTLAPKLQVFVYDWDQVGSDDPLGRFAVTCDDIVKTTSVIELNPMWYQLTDFQGNVMPESKILMAFQLLTHSEAHQVGDIPNITPQTAKMQLEVTTLGLRDLQSTFGVHKTFLNFEMPGGKRFSTRQSKAPSAKSPNFLQVLKVDVDLPTKPIFAPMLNLEVRDVLLGGFVKRLIGNSSIDMSQFMEEDGKGGWVPVVKPLSLASDAQIEKELSDEAKAAKEAALRAKMEEAQKAAAISEAKKAKEEEPSSPSGKDEKKEKKEEKKELKSEGKDELSKPLLGDESSDHVVDVKENIDSGEGVGDLGERKDDANPLAQSDEEKKAGGFKDKEGPAEGDKYDPAQDHEEADPEEETPPYMKGRATIDDELEDSLFMNPFHSVPLMIGQKNAGPLGKKLTRVGTFKGLVRLIDPSDEKAGAPLFDMKELLTPQQLFCRLYILRGLQLSPKDSNNLSDPYLVIKLGNEKLSTRDRYCKNTLNPDFYERFEIPCTIPGDATIDITAWDWDGIGDDLIGSTQIDIEDRWFTKEWRKLPLKPLERRTLRTKSSRRSQGKLELWCELVTPEQAKKTPMWDIKPPPPDPYELRLIIWGVRDITIKDLTTNQNDLFCTGAISTKGLKKQETDTHWRSKKGKGNFNWRMKWTLDLPQKPWPRLRMQVWDLDIFSPSDSICETVLTLKGLCKRALKKKDRVKIYMKGKDRFKIDNLRHPNFKGNQGNIEISLELMPQSMATQLPAGFGRSDPNLNPFLPEPEGRVNWSLLHPFDMLKEILGPELYRKICFGCCCMLFVAACVFMAPMIVSNVISNILTP